LRKPHVGLAWLHRFGLRLVLAGLACCLTSQSGPGQAPLIVNRLPATLDTPLATSEPRVTRGWVVEEILVEARAKPSVPIREPNVLLLSPIARIAEREASIQLMPPIANVVVREATQPIANVVVREPAQPAVQPIHRIIIFETKPPEPSAAPQVVVFEPAKAPLTPIPSVLVFEPTKVPAGPVPEILVFEPVKRSDTPTPDILIFEPARPSLTSIPRVIVFEPARPPERATAPAFEFNLPPVPNFGFNVPAVHEPNFEVSPSPPPVTSTIPVYSWPLRLRDEHALITVAERPSFGYVIAMETSALPEPQWIDNPASFLPPASAAPTEPLVRFDRPVQLIETTPPNAGPNVRFDRPGQMHETTPPSMEPILQTPPLPFRPRNISPIN
jgi:hypothetical protein